MTINNEKKIFVDIGSSTVKVYKQDKDISLLFNRSIPFKEGFDPEAGITDNNKKELLELLTELKEKHSGYLIKLYATALYRKLETKAHIMLVDEIYERTGLFFNIISHDLENYYLEVALVGSYSKDEPVLLANIGGGSTELVVMYGNEAIEKHNIDLGVGTLITEFPQINEQHSKITVSEIVAHVKTLLPTLQNKVNIGFHSGGELTYMKIAGYDLEKNNVFEDVTHPNKIALRSFIARNKEIFSKVTIQELKNLMPENPKWMLGARPCSAIAQAIFEKYGVRIIIPSDSNLINGVARQEFRYATISGSFRKHLDYILKVRNYLVSKNVQVLSPRFTEPKNPGEEFVVFTGEEGCTPLELERHHLTAIEKSDALVVCDPAGYVGASALIEIGYAQSLGKKIIFVEKPEEFMLNTLPADIGL